MEISKYDFDLLKMYSSSKCYNENNEELSYIERLALIYYKLLEIEREQPQ